MDALTAPARGLVPLRAVLLLIADESALPSLAMWAPPPRREVVAHSRPLARVT